MQTSQLMQTKIWELYFNFTILVDRSPVLSQMGAFNRPGGHHRWDQRLLEM